MDTRVVADQFQRPTLSATSVSFHSIAGASSELTLRKEASPLIKPVILG
jgi:hypothetical protein